MTAAISKFHKKGDKENFIEHNSAVEANASWEAGTSSEMKISF